MLFPKIPQKAKYLIVFGLGFFFFFILQYSHTLADPDSFYHAKMALLMREQGVVTEFPWLGDFTVLGQAYTDQHFLYHVLLIPFVTFFQPITGLKLVTVLLASCFFLTFYWFLNKLKVRFALFFSLLLFTMNPLIFRLSLAKAPSFSLIFLLLAIYFIIKRRWKPLLPLSFFYVWAYGGFLLVIFAAGLYLTVSIITNVYKRIFIPAKLSWRQAIFDPSWKTFLATLIGVASGVVINPYFPQNLKFYYYQLFEIGVKNYRDIIGVGGEWYPYDISSLISSTVFLTIALIGSLIIFSLNIKKQTRREIFFLLLAVFFLILTLKSRRYVEYYVPFAALFSFQLIGRLVSLTQLRHYLRQFVRLYLRKKVIISIVAIYFLVTVPTIMIRGFLSERSSLVNGIPYTKFQLSSDWLKSHSQTGDIVFHSSWDEFPMLFYHNDKNNYIGGLDQTFMYLYDKDLHQKWVEITTGRMKNNLLTIIRDQFRARYILVSADHSALRANLIYTNEFKKVYEDDEAVIFEVPGK